MRSANLDLAAEAAVQRGMAQAAAGCTTLLIAHRLQTTRIAGRILVIEDGQVVEDGDHDQLIAAGGRYATLWSMGGAGRHPHPDLGLHTVDAVLCEIKD